MTATLLLLLEAASVMVPTWVRVYVSLKLREKRSVAWGIMNAWIEVWTCVQYGHSKRLLLRPNPPAAGLQEPAALPPAHRAHSPPAKLGAGVAVSCVTLWLPHTVRGVYAS